MACRELLLTLNRMGLITLPPRLKNANNEKRNRSIPVVKIDQIPLQDKLGNLAPVELKPVRNTKLEPLYNLAASSQHHYLGYRQIVGLRLVEDNEPTPRRAIISSTSLLSSSGPLPVWGGPPARRD